MPDYYEIDFLNVGPKKSGDAIPIRYSTSGNIRIHVVDGGFQEKGEELVNHIKQYFDSPSKINAVVVTHPDGDHAGGLRKLFENFEIDELWMLRPWLYVDELINLFKHFTSKDNLKKRLKELYPNIAKLEELADENEIPILEPFQGNQIGEFVVLAPSKERYLELIVESERTPEAIKTEQESLLHAAEKILIKATKYIRSIWGAEIFPDEDTSPENNMSLVQFAVLCGKKILLTGDAGRETLSEAIEYAPSVGLSLPGIDRIQIPHHGSRHNVSSEILDNLLGPKLYSKQENFHCFISAAKEDEDHPRKSVVRAFIHRGGQIFTTKGSNLCTSLNAPSRNGWIAAQAVPYPEDQEE